MTQYPPSHALSASLALPLLFGAALLLALPSGAEARMPEGFVHCDSRNRANCNAWWDRRSKKQKEWLLSFEMQDRNPAVVCMTLLGFPEPNAKLDDCTKKQIGNQRSLKHCMDQGHDIMGEATLACQNSWKRANGY